MILDRVFHIYKKSTGEVIDQSLTTDQFEDLLRNKLIDLNVCEVEPCSVEYYDASY